MLMWAARNLPTEYRQIRISSGGIFGLHRAGQLYQREASTETKPQKHLFDFFTCYF